MLEKKRRDVFYKYEKRIRELSTQEKVRSPRTGGRDLEHRQGCALNNLWGPALACKPNIATHILSSSHSASLHEVTDSSPPVGHHLLSFHL